MTKTKLNRFLEKEQKKIDKDIKDLKSDYSVDVEMGYTRSYEEWLEIRYIELHDLFERINADRIELLIKKYEKK